MESENSITEMELATAPITHAELQSIAEPSESFVGNWHKLTSTTNWEKGRIIFQWRAKLMDSGVSSRLYSDPAWSRLVGEVSAQHVGRLRRTYQRFADDYEQYSGLHWSHFYAALDWNDAEMWLEGAVQNKWSVAKMRFQRWEALGAIKDQKPDVRDIVITPGDEGISLIQPPKRGEGLVRIDDQPGIQGPNLSEQRIQGPVFEGPDFGDELSSDSAKAQKGSSAAETKRVDIELLLAEMPDDIAEPFKQLRAAIEKLKQNDWKTIKRIKIVALINDLKQLLRTVPNTNANLTDKSENKDGN